MNKKAPWTAPRIAFLVLLVLCIGLLLTGIWWTIAGNSMAHQPFADGEDVGPLAGFALELVGIGLLIVGSILSLLFGWLYHRATRRSMHLLPPTPPVVAPGPAPKSPF